MEACNLNSVIREFSSSFNKEAAGHVSTKTNGGFSFLPQPESSHKSCNRISKLKNSHKSCNKISYNVVMCEQMAQSGNLKQCALFLILKAKYSNSCIYGWSIKGLSGKFGFSRAFLKKSIALFLTNGWCRIDGKNLIFNKLKSFDSNKQYIKYTLNIHSGAKIKDVLYNLRLNLIKHKESKFQYLKKLEGDINRPTNSLLYKRALKALKKTGLKKESLPRENSKLTVSVKGFAKMFGCSKTMAHNIVSSFKGSGDLLCDPGGWRRVIWSFDPIVIKSALASVPGSHYSGGVVYKSAPNQYYFAV